MTPGSQSDRLLVERVRSGDPASWQELIDRFEGRLLAFVRSRIGSRVAAEDVVQESFVGFLTSLPNYDQSRSLESYLFSIAAHKLTDYLRREGRRPTVSMTPSDSGSGSWEPPGAARPASSIHRSKERKSLEENAVAKALADQFEHWHNRGDWKKLRCMELLFVAGLGNKDAAAQLDMSEQQVANCKFDFLARLRKAIRQQGLNDDVFPELYEIDS